MKRCKLGGRVDIRRRKGGREMEEEKRAEIKRDPDR